MIKILGIVCSPRVQSNTGILVKEALEKSKSLGAEVELVTLAGKKLEPCNGCLTCRETRVCHIQDDIQDIYTKLLEADGIIFGSPVYFWNVTAQAKILIDRSYVLLGKFQPLTERRLRNKVAGVVVSTNRDGGTSAMEAFLGFINRHSMTFVDGITGFGTNEKESVRKDTRALREAAVLGANMVSAAIALKSRNDDAAQACHSEFTAKGAFPVEYPIVQLPDNINSPL